MPYYPNPPILVITKLKRHWFYTDSGQENPNKTVFLIINFARKHKYALQRSILTYAEKKMPSRLDFTKGWYGGPSTMEQVKML